MCCFTPVRPVFRHETPEDFAAFLSEVQSSKHRSLRVDELGRLHLTTHSSSFAAAKVSRGLHIYLKENLDYVDNRLPQEAQEGLRALLHYPGAELADLDHDLARDLAERLEKLFWDALEQKALETQAEQLKRANASLEQQLSRLRRARSCGQARARWPEEEAQLDLTLKDATLHLAASPWSVFESVLATGNVDWSQYSSEAVQLYDAYLRQELSSCRISTALAQELHSLAQKLGDTLFTRALEQVSCTRITWPQIKVLTPDYYLDQETTKLILMGCTQKLDRIAKARWSQEACQAEHSCLDGAQLILRNTLDLRADPEIRSAYRRLQELWKEALQQQSFLELKIPNSGLLWFHQRKETGDLTIHCAEEDVKIHRIYYPEAVSTDLSSYDSFATDCLLAALYGQRRMLSTTSFRIAVEIGAMNLAQELYGCSYGPLGSSTEAQLEQLVAIPAAVNAYRHYAALASHFPLLTELPHLLHKIAPEHLLRLAARDDLRADESTVWAVIRDQISAQPAFRQRLIDCVRWERCTRSWICAEFPSEEDGVLLDRQKVRALLERAKAEALEPRARGPEGSFRAFFPPGEKRCISQRFADGAQLTFSLDGRREGCHVEILAFGRRWSRPFTAIQGHNRFVIEWAYVLGEPHFETFELYLERFPYETSESHYAAGSIARYSSRVRAEGGLGLHHLPGLALRLD